jgi:hypothetical protein
MNTAEQFWGLVERGAAGECWPWLGSVDRDGHGRVYWQGRHTGAHRVAFGLAQGQPVLPGVVIRHRCDNPACCNPAHLVIGTHTDNVRDRVAAGHSATGERNGRAKLTEHLAQRVRELAAGGVSLSALARLLGVDRAAVRRIVNGKAWRPPY